MLSQEIALSIKQALAPLVDVRDFAILDTDEFESEATPPSWYDPTNDSLIIKLQLLDQPDKNVIKHISDICYHTRSQVYIADEGDNIILVYLCPTENEFETMYSLCGDPNPSLLTQ